MTDVAAGCTEVGEVLQCLADVLEREVDELDADTTLVAAGLESFAAVRLRRLLHEETGLDLPLTAFLGTATARTVAAGIVPDDSPAPAASVTPRPATGVGIADEAAFALTPVQAAYLVGRDPAFPLGGVATFYYAEFDRVPAGDPHTDLDRLTAAWNALVARHPMLRMTIGTDGRQRVHPDPGPYAIAVTDLRTDPDPGTQLAALRHECSHQLRPAGRWPLHDVRAALLPDGRTRLFVGVDVLALDMASWLLLMREWGALLAGADLPAPPTTFAEVLARRATDPAERDRRARDAAWWAGRAEDLPPGPVLPWTEGATSLRGHRFTRHAASLPLPEWTRLREHAAAHGVSATAVLLAAFARVLHAWGATAPFGLNTTLFDRPDEAAGVVGDFTTTVLVAVPPVHGPFAEYAGAVNHRFWADLEHRAVPGTEVLTDRPAEPGTGLPLPTHPVVFTSGVGLTGRDGDPTAWLGEKVYGISQTPQVLIDHIVGDEGGDLTVAWDVVDGALPAGFAEGMRDAHLVLLHRLAGDPDAWTDPALGWVPSMHADPARPSAAPGAGSLIHDPLRGFADSAAPALIGAREMVPHDVLAARADATGRVLAAAGVGPGDLVVVAAEKGPAQVTAVLGVLAAGAGYVPVDPAWPAARIASVCEQASVRHALVRGSADLPVDVHVHALAGDGTLRSTPGERATTQPSGPEPHDLAYAIFTSGSTGRPKGVAVEHRAARTTLDDVAARFPIGPGDRVLALSALSFDLSVYDVFGLLGAGGALVLPDPERQRDPGHWLELMAGHGVTVWNTAPALLEMLVEYAEVDPDTARAGLGSLRLVLLSGDWIPVTLPDRVRALAPQAQVVSLGGATEASIWSIHFPIAAVDGSWTSIPYGRALGGQSFLVLDDEGAPCPVGVTGELFIGGDGLARCYVGDPDQTAARFAVHPVLGERLYRTGDLGRWRVDGTIEFLGRVDRQVKVHGHRIELGELESALDRAPAVRQAVARAVPGPDGRPRLVCYVAPADPAAPPSDDELTTVLRASLPAYMVPSRFVHLDALPVTDNGKVDHTALPDPFRRPGAAATTPADRSRATLLQDSPQQGIPASSAPQRGVPASGFVAAGTPRCDDPVLQAVAAGLELRLVVDAGRLSPVDALTAAAGTVARIRDDLAARTGLPVTEESSRDGLVVLVLRPPAAGNVDTVAPRVAATPADPAPGACPGTAADAAPPPPHITDPRVRDAVTAVIENLVEGAVDTATPFFRLGATSLTLVLAHRRLQAELHADLQVVDLFTHPTVEALAFHITASRRATGAADAPSSAAPVAAPPVPAAASTTPDRTSARRAARLRAAEVAR